MTGVPSRRRVLGYVGVALTGGLAGCTGDDSTGSPTSGPSLAVSDQRSEGSTLTVQSVSLTADAWLVVHPAGENGPDSSVVLAKKLLSPGTYNSVSVALDPPRTTTQTLYVVLHADDPNDGELTFPDGDPPVEADGGHLIESLTLTVERGT